MHGIVGRTGAQRLQSLGCQNFGDQRAIIARLHGVLPRGGLHNWVSGPRNATEGVPYSSKPEVGNGLRAVPPTLQFKTRSVGNGLRAVPPTRHVLYANSLTRVHRGLDVLV